MNSRVVCLKFAQSPSSLSSRDANHGAGRIGFCAARSTALSPRWELTHFNFFSGGKKSPEDIRTDLEVPYNRG